MAVIAAAARGQDKGRGDVLLSSSVVELLNFDINERGHQFTQYSESSKIFTYEQFQEFG